MPDGKYNIVPYGGGPVIMTGVDEACFNQFGDITLAEEGDTRCVGPSTGGGSQTGPASGACGLPTDQKFIKCPPSNGITADYYLDAQTGRYSPNMTTQSPACADASNVIQVGANSPYCDGGEVSGPGNALPTLVACFYMPGNTFEETRVFVHGGPNFEVLAEDIMLKDIPARFPGQRWIVVRQERCTPLPDFGISAAAPAPAPAPTPTPAPAPTPTPAPAPPPLPTQPIGGGVVPMPMQAQPMAMPQPMSRQVPMTPKAAPPPPPAPAPAPRPAAKCPPSPAKGNEWWNYCLTKEQAVYPTYVQPNTTIETALGIGAVAAAAALAIFAFKG